MPTTIKVWEIVGNGLKPQVDESFAASHKEDELESWIALHTELLGDEQKLLIIDRQRDVPGVGRLDLLGIDRSGQLVVIELKRDRAPREAVAQALDYASWLDGESPETIRRYAEEFLKGKLDEAFREMFGELPTESGLELDCQNHRIVLVATRLDASAERMINYLSDRHGVDINAVFFTYARLSDGKEIIARTTLVGDDLSRGPRRPETRRRPPSIEELRAIAAARGVQPQFDECRAVGQLWWEERIVAFGGSLSYWADKSVFGIVPGEAYLPSHGQLDVWVMVKNLSQLSGVAADAIRSVLEAQGLAVRETWADRLWLRLNTVEQAQLLVAQLQKWKLQKSAAAAG